MAFELNDKIKNLSPYDPVEGEYDIRLDANESFITPPQEILDEISKAVLGVEFNRYPDPYATKLCKMFSAYFGVSQDYVTAGNGSDELISVIFSAFTQKGDSVMGLSPDFSMYKFYAHLAECEYVKYRKKENFSVDIDDLIENVNESGVKMLIFSNPCNPTSCVIDRGTILRLVSSVKCLVVVDEAYMDFSNESVLDMVEEYDNLIVLRTCSKAFGMASLRLGFAVAGSTVTDALRSVKSPYNVSSVDQAIGTVVLSHQDYLRDCTSKIIAARDKLYSRLSALQKKAPRRIRVIKPCTNFVYVWYDNAGGLFNILKEYGIVVRNIGEYLRITAGTDEEIESVVRVIENSLSK